VTAPPALAAAQYSPEKETEPRQLRLIRSQADVIHAALWPFSRVSAFDHGCKVSL
jgi:hypothetical protein